MAKDKKKLSDQVAKGTSMDDGTPPGMLPDGKLDIVKADDPPYRPTLVDDDGNVIEEGEE